MEWMEAQEPKDGKPFRCKYKNGLLIKRQSSPKCPEDVETDVACDIPGELVHWQADYCLYKNETDDFWQEGVQACFQVEKQKSFKNTCAAKNEYKHAMCQMMASYPPYNGSTTKCLEDKTFSGPAVRDGGI